MILYGARCCGDSADLSRKIRTLYLSKLDGVIEVRFPVRNIPLGKAERRQARVWRSYNHPSNLRFRRYESRVHYLSEFGIGNWIFFRLFQELPYLYEGIRRRGLYWFSLVVPSRTSRTTVSVIQVQPTMASVLQLSHFFVRFSKRGEMPRISNHGGLWKHCLKALVLLTNVGKTTAISQLLPINGISGELTGYPGLAYHAIRYEPLCGNLGSGARYSNPIDMTDRCKPAMESFGNNTNDNVALYDITGSRLPDGRVGGGYDVCLCFALSQIDGGIKGALCLWVDGAGRADVWWSLHLDDILAGNFRPNVDKALPLCKDVNVASLKAQWSSTAAQPSFSEKTASAPGGSGRTRVEVSTFIPSGKFLYFSIPLVVELIAR